MFYSLWSRS